ncbi:hypothetical protein C8R45DRAFT_1075303 [Mycena sanguinolenta]|nr:hypothetical protein C8R45DRAFT_1075303 [Mycena sanguinolenta]
MAVIFVKNPARLPAQTMLYRIHRNVYAKVRHHLWNDWTIFHRSSSEWQHLMACRQRPPMPEVQKVWSSSSKNHLQAPIELQKFVSRLSKSGACCKEPLLLGVAPLPALISVGSKLMSDFVRLRNFPVGLSLLLDHVGSSLCSLRATTSDKILKYSTRTHITPEVNMSTISGSLSVCSMACRFEYGGSEPPPASSVREMNLRGIYCHGFLLPSCSIAQNFWTQSVQKIVLRDNPRSDLARSCFYLVC